MIIIIGVTTLQMGVELFVLIIDYMLCTFLNHNIP
jgi:hypothetical protein